MDSRRIVSDPLQRRNCVRDHRQRFFILVLPHQTLLQFSWIRISPFLSKFWEWIFSFYSAWMNLSYTSLWRVDWKIDCVLLRNSNILASHLSNKSFCRSVIVSRNFKTSKYRFLSHSPSGRVRRCDEWMVPPRGSRLFFPDHILASACQHSQKAPWYQNVVKKSIHWWICNEFSKFLILLKSKCKSKFQGKSKVILVT